MISQRQNNEKITIPENVQNKWQEMLDVLVLTMSVQTVMISRINNGQHEVFLSSQSPDHSNNMAVINSEHFNVHVINKCVPLEICDIKNEPFWHETHDVSTGLNFYYGLPLIWNDGKCFGSISILDFQKNSSFDSYRRLIQYFKKDIESDLVTLEEVSRVSHLDDTSKYMPDIHEKNDVEIKQQEKGISDSIDVMGNTFVNLLNNFNETSFQNMLNGFPGGIIILNHQNEIIGANRTAQDLLFLQRERNGLYCFANPKRQINHSSGEMSLEDLIKPEEIDNLLTQNKRFSIEQLNGTVRWLEINETQLPDIQNNLDVRALTFQDITNQIDTDATLREREDQFRLKLDSILSPDIEVSEQDLVRIIDVEPVESLLQDFSDLTGFLTAIIDVKGKILVATGWSDICTKFHRVHPEMSVRCIESDTSLAKKTRVGEYIEHRCFNHLRSVATPLIIAGKHVADIYTGQFFYEDEVIDKTIFEKQAERYGFNKDAYLAAFDRIPVVSHKSVKLVMDFLTKFSELVSQLGYSNLKLAKSISEQRRIEGALRESEKHFRMLTSQAPIPIAISNFQNQMEYFNEKFISTFGYTIEDCPDYETWWLKAYPDEEYREYVKEKWGREFNKTMGNMVEVQPDEYFITGKDGSVHIVEIFGSRIGDKFLGIVNDITERKRIEEFMIQREKLVGIGTLAAGITHEMNSPLQVITGMIGSSKRLLESGDADNEELLRRLNIIDKNAWRLAHIVRSLLDYARSAPGENAVFCSLNDLVNQTLMLTEHQFKSWSNVVINANLDENIPMTIFDTNQITQVIINLLTNARDAMPDGGEISLWTSFDAMTNMIHLRVEDTGPGIPEEIQNKIFDPFFTTKPIGEGTGLGLSIVAGIIRGHHGDIKLERSSKEGTVFDISFPVVQALFSERDRENQGRY